MTEEKLQPPRGTRDFAPGEKLARDAVVSRLKKIFERYGFNPLETPALENWGVLASKYAGGEEILKESYKLVDQGGRELGLRYDLTVPLCRFIAANPRLAMPFKRYQVEKVWRDGPVSSQRLREFLQCDADTVGAASMAADAEILALASDFFAEIGLACVIKVNNRKLLNALLETAGVSKQKVLGALLSIDKLEKIGVQQVAKEMVQERGIDAKTSARVLKSFEELGKARDNRELLEALEKILGKEGGGGGLKELRDLLEYCEALGARNVVVDASLARGLAYYTGSVFEVFLKNSPVAASVAGGGRYDELVGAFLASGQKIPAVGISFGIERIMEALEAAKKTEGVKTVARAFVVPVNENVFGDCLKTTKALRKAGVNCVVDLMARGLSKNLEWASKQEIPFCVIIGERELKEKKVRLRSMETGEEKLLDLGGAVKILQA